MGWAGPSGLKPIIFYTNYLSWSFHLKNFVEGQGMLGYLDGATPKPIAGTTDGPHLPHLL